MGSVSEVIDGWGSLGRVLPPCRRPRRGPVDQGSGELREEGAGEAGLKNLLDGIRLGE